MTRDFAFIQTAPGRLFVGWGPFDQAPVRRAGRPAFFITDFFLGDPHPWRHPAEWEELSTDELAERFPDSAPPDVVWEPPSLGNWAALFDSAVERMRRGDFNKIVPVVFESGRLATPAEWGFFARRLRTLPAGMRAYGYSYKNHGLVGATPELLFESDGRAYRTMALAGTRPVARSAELLTDAKELREHRMVVDDIVRRLAPFGNLEVGPLGVIELPTIAHLTTPIRFQESAGDRMSFGEMIRRLHPTAALGVSPRTDAGERWLREADRGIKRKTFGAPFGLDTGDASTAVVAIRNLEWDRDRIRVGAGAGLLPESRLEREFEELRQKREQVKRLFGLQVGEQGTTMVTSAPGSRVSS
jgi:isochorismate synthase EntC